MFTNGNGPESFAEWERALWEAADPEMHGTTQGASHIGDDQTRWVAMKVLTFIKKLRHAREIGDREIKRLYRHLIRQQLEIRELEDTVGELQTVVEILAKRERERSAREALGGIEAGEDMDTVFSDLGRPEGLSGSPVEGGAS